MSTGPMTGVLPDVNVVPEPVETFFDTLTDPGFWKRTGIIAIGAFMVIYGGILLVGGSRAVKDLTKIATSVATKGIV